jgi:ATP-dependent phosphofructokinase / diphosphate-dependent phosphofructokinase
VAQHKMGILVGGGPAPGVNSVMSAATIRARLDGVEVVGIQDGFKWIMQGDSEHVMPLSVEDVSRINFRGGSHIGISRSNPTVDPQRLENSVLALLRLNVSQLVTIGGIDTIYSAVKVEERAAGRIRVVHVPKTIDNDLGLPGYVDTLGFQTARDYGVEIVKDLMVDAETTQKWHFVVTMGRKAGHLALGMGKAAGAALTIIPEEFGNRSVPLREIVDILAGAMIKRLSYGRQDGVAVVAEGVVLKIVPDDLKELEHVERDVYGEVRVSDIDLGEILKAQVVRRLKELGIKTSITAKTVGYELRCADPIPFDVEYSRDLGYCAAEYLLGGGNAAMVSIQAGQFVPVPFDQLMDPATGRTRVRLVNVQSSRYAIARRYMLRLRREDFDDPHELARLAATCRVSLQDFREQFEYLIRDEPAVLVTAPAPEGRAAQP